MRRQVRACLGAWRLTGAEDGVPLVVSELVTNAMRHAPCPAIGLTVTAGDAELLIEVRDGSGTPPVMRLASGPEGEDGRGLPLVHALSRDWGWTPHDDGAKTTWAVLPA